MPNWLLKTALHRFISVLPASHRVNEFFQNRVTKSLRLGRGAFEAALENCQRHFNYFQETNSTPSQEFTVLELGTGWYPIIPLGLYLCGASQIWSFDIVPLLNQERMKIIAQYFLQFEQEGVLRRLLPSARPERIAKVCEAARAMEQLSPAEALNRFGVRAIVADAQRTTLPPNSVDFFFSTVVLEHIPRAVLANLFKEFHRLARKSAVMSHWIGLGDQFATFDRSLTDFNFLKFSERQWRFLNSPLIPQNRLRISDYRELVREAGFRVLHEVNTLGTPAQLEAIPLASQFRQYHREDLLVTRTWIVAQAI